MFKVNNVDCENVLENIIKKYGDLINEADGDFKLTNK